MAKDFSDLEEQERLKAENEYLKMKLMLEKGAKFGGDDELEIDPQIENQFLKNVIEFEKQFDEHKTIKIFDKIGKPTQFRPVAEVPDAEIDKAWQDLYDHLYKYSIELSVCSPNISARELYRFATEELFELQMDDISVPGMIHGFIYDEFHPDPVYDNTRTAMEECISYIMEKEHLKWTHNFNKDKLRLNEHFPLTREELKLLINRFKDAYDDIQLTELGNKSCIIENDKCQVTGDYKMITRNGTEKCEFAGSWEVSFNLEKEFGYWHITEIRIEGISF